MPMTGQPIFAARSMTLHIFSAMTSPSDPPKTVKSWENTQTGRPSIRPCPVTTASPQGLFFCMSKSCVRCRTKVSSSWNEPGSSRLLDPLAGGHLALGVVLLDGGLGALEGGLAALVELRQLLFEGLRCVFAHGGGALYLGSP